MTIVKTIIENIIPEQYRATPEEHQRRVAICMSCHVRKGKTNSCGKLILGSRVWSKEKQKWVNTCGCVVDGKALIKEEDCEVGKW